MNSIITVIENFEKVCIDIATGQRELEENKKKYSSLRRSIRKYFNNSNVLPEWVNLYRNSDIFWSYIKKKHSSYQQRREEIWSSFEEVYSHIENLEKESPLDKTLRSINHNQKSDYLNEQWEKAIERRNSDPDGAITLARTILESTCKIILEEKGIEYEDQRNNSLQSLFKLVRERVLWSDQQETNNEIKKILSGLSQIVEGIATVRGLVGDAHGKGKKKYKISERHSVLTLNSAFTLTIFLWDTFNDNS